MTEGMQDTTAADAAAKAAADAAAAATAAAAGEPKVPDTYTLAKPEGFLFSDEALGRVVETAKALKLPDDASAQQVLAVAHELAAEAIKTYEQARQPDGAFYKELVAKYEAEALAHPDLGRGDAAMLEQKGVNAGLVLKQFGPELADVLKASGLSARKEFLLFANRVHAAMQEKPHADGNPAAKVLAPHKALFPDGIPDDVGATNQRP